MWKIIYSCWLYEKTHQTVHEGCKNFKCECESCRESFTPADFLSRHIDIIHWRLNGQCCCFDSNDNNKKLTAQCTERTFNKIENPFKGTFAG